MSAEREGREAAEQYRRDHHLGTQPLGDLIALIDLVEGIDVTVIRSPAEDAHGITVRDPATGMVILVATTTANATRLRSTIAHELAHHLFGDKAPEDNTWGPRHEESRADAFARHLLLPLDALPDVLGSAADRARPITTSDVSALVQRFAISPQMVAIQLRQARYISEQQKDEWKATLSAPSLSTRYGWSNLYTIWQSDSQTTRPPQRLLARAIDGYTQGLISIDTIARLEDITPAAAQAALDDAGITVQPVAAEPVDDAQLPLDRSQDALAAFDAEFGDDG